MNRQAHEKVIRQSERERCKKAVCRWCREGFPTEPLGPVRVHRHHAGQVVMVLDCKASGIFDLEDD